MLDALAAPILLAALVQLPPPARAVPSEGEWLAARAAQLAAARGDPPIHELQVAAARQADPLAGEESLVPRSRASALLPKVSAEVRFDDRSYRVAGLQATGEVDYVRDAPGWSVALTATWDLAGLALSPAERVDAAGALARARRRDEAVRRATAACFERRRLRLALALDPPANPLDRAATELEIARLGAELDALTGGLLREGVR